MTPHQIVVVLLRLSAMIWLLFTLTHMYGIFAVYDYAEGVGLSRPIVLLSAAFQVFVCLALWFFPSTIASNLLRSEHADTSFVDQVRALGVEDDLLEEGLTELAAVIEGCSSGEHRHVSVEANLRIARGLDYYTGTVVEIFMAGYERLKSVGGGGRYDALASDGRTTYPGVGVSFGVSRTLIPLLADGVLGGSRPVPSAVLVALPDEESRGACDAVAQRLRARGIPTEVAASPQKFGKQIRYAERRGIPFVWFPAVEPGGVTGDHEVKDIRSGDQEPADPDAWTPPAEDLRPHIVVSTTETD